MFGLFKKKKREVLAPFAGEVLDLELVPDMAFSQKMVGEGFAIKPEEKDGLIKVLAPISGKLSMLFPTGHAFGIVAADGFEVLVHLGIDTVELEGEGFSVEAKVGDEVKAGEVILTMDVKKIIEKDKDPISPVVFTKREMVKEVEIVFGKKQALDLACLVK